MWTSLQIQIECCPNPGLLHLSSQPHAPGMLLISLEIQLPNWNVTLCAYTMVGNEMQKWEQEQSLLWCQTFSLCGMSTQNQLELSLTFYWGGIDL